MTFNLHTLIRSTWFSRSFSLSFLSVALLLILHNHINRIAKQKQQQHSFFFLGRTHKYTLIKWYGKKPSSRYTLTRVNIQRAITITTTTTLWHGIDGIVVVIKRVEDLETHLTHGPSNGIECEKRKQISHAMTVFVSYGCLSPQEFLVHYFNVCVIFSVFLFRQILFFFFNFTTYKREDCLKFTTFNVDCFLFVFREQFVFVVHMSLFDSYEMIHETASIIRAITFFFLSSILGVFVFSVLMTFFRSFFQAMFLFSFD